MMDNKGFPIKYAVEPIYIRDGVDQIGNEKYDVDFYIATKCYVVEDIIKYFENGESKAYHKVVYPFQDRWGFFNVSMKYSEQKEMDEIVYEEVIQKPKYDIYGNCYNFQFNTAVYDSLEEAVLARDIANKDLASKKLLTHDNYGNQNLYIENQINKNMEEFQEQVFKYTEEPRIEKQRVK